MHFNFIVIWRILKSFLSEDNIVMLTQTVFILDVSWFIYTHPLPEGDLPDDGYGNTFILTGTSEHLTMKTPQPPGDPNNLGVVATTCHSMQVAWDPPHETGVDIIGK